MRPRGAAVRLLLALALLPIGACAEQASTPEPLREVYQPHFRQVPPREPAGESLRKIAEGWRGPTGAMVRRDLRSWQGAALGVSLAVVLLVGRSRRRSNGPAAAAATPGPLPDLLLLWAIGACLFNSMRFFERGWLENPTALNLLDWVFTAVVLLSLASIGRSFWLAARPAGRAAWQPALPLPALAAVALLLLLVNLALAVVRPPDDAGEFVNLGAQRLRERGRLPYGDPLLTGTAGAAYGPLLYMAHVPFQVAVSPGPINERSPARPALGPDSTYYAPPVLATQLCTAGFHLAGVAALFAIARRRAGLQAALGAVALYCGSLAVLGIGGREYSVAGITFVSHIAPASMTLLALAAVRRPALAGALLVAAAGAGFYPAFMWPAWLGHYWNDRRARFTFVAACVAAAVLLSALVMALSRPAGEMNRVETILRDTFGHHTEAGGYGESPFGFWGQREGVREFLMTPLAGSGLTSPAWLLFGLMAASTFFVARGRGLPALALLSGAIALGSALVKPHATSTYLAWYYGLILLGVLLPHQAPGAMGAQPGPSDDARDVSGTSSGNPRISNSQMSFSRASG